VEAMKLYYEKLEEYASKQKEVNTKHLKRALLQVLRHTHDIQSDGTQGTSSGSDNAPSDDNLDPEEIERVVPIDDPALLKLIKKKRKERQAQEQATSISPARKKNP